MCSKAVLWELNYFSYVNTWFVVGDKVNGCQHILTALTLYIWKQKMFCDLSIEVSFSTNFTAKNGLKKTWVPACLMNKFLNEFISAFWDTFPSEFMSQFMKLSKFQCFSWFQKKRICRVTHFTKQQFSTRCAKWLRNVLRYWQ